MRESWDDFWMKMVDLIATRSKDTSTQVGCVITQNNRLVSMGYNGPPRWINDERVIEIPRPAKYLYFEHAERNAIYNARVDLSGSDMYVGWLPCADCARAIIQSDLDRVVVKSFEIPDHWRDSCIAGLEMMVESGVVVDLTNDRGSVAAAGNDLFYKYPECSVEWVTDRLKIVRNET